ncbi:hypothetical protein P0082_07125 [Candidatus Haliotispira prima]|uniref:Uncharacterized protein n=1 Tax=Candidatus Haliotispira prima TaxID=3034016 RepID=A0ABY8ME46_9SPIO|nr:hypothetical protein P0082_07125 [Candidatus Haliotispira prima]
MPLSDTTDPSSDPPAAPKYTFTISFTGTQSLELTISSVEDITVSAIVRLTDESAPVWADIKDKVGLLSRNIVAGTPKRIFTAKHYGTNDSLQTNIGAMSAADFLQPETAYKVYIFHNESVIETLPFTTAAIPPASEFPSISTVFSAKFAPNVLPFNAEETYTTLEGFEGKGLYELYGKEGEVLLIPMYMKESVNTGWRFINGIGVLSVSCAFSSCLPNAGYALTPEVIYQSVAANTYHKVSLGFQYYNSKKVDAGVTGVIDGSGGDGSKLYFIRFIADQ